MPKRQPTLYCRTCRDQRPREAFSARRLATGRWQPWASCDECRAKRLTPPIAAELPNERWWPVLGFEGIYEISNYTRVRRASACSQSPERRLLNPFLTGHGYLAVALSDRDGGRNYFVHRLYIEALIGPIPEGLVINHINGDKTNNWLGNLEVVTQGENNRHARRTGLCDTRGERNGSAKLTEGQIREIRASTDTLSELAQRFDVCFQLISKIRRCEVWTHVA